MQCTYIYRHNHDVRDLEKQREKEREQRERDRLERDRQEREKIDREKHEKEQRQAQAAVQKHFEESLKRIQQKVGFFIIASSKRNLMLGDKIRLK